MYINLSRQLACYEGPTKNSVNNFNYFIFILYMYVCMYVGLICQWHKWVSEISTILWVLQKIFVESGFGKKYYKKEKDTLHLLKF